MDVKVIGSVKELKELIPPLPSSTLALIDEVKRRYPEKFLDLDELGSYAEQDERVMSDAHLATVLALLLEITLYSAAISLMGINVPPEVLGGLAQAMIDPKPSKADA